MRMRFLIGLACAAVIAAAGFWFWQQYTEQQQAADAARRADLVAACLRFADQMAHGDATKNQPVGDCTSQGYITTEDIDRIRAAAR